MWYVAAVFVILYNSIAFGAQNSIPIRELEEKRAKHFLADFISGWDEETKKIARDSYGPKEKSTLFSYYLDEYKSGNDLRSFDLAKIFLEGDIDPSYSDQVVNWLEGSISTSKGEAETILGHFHERGYFVEKDRNRAIDFYEEGWRKGDPAAAYHLARNQLDELSSGEDVEAIIMLLNEAGQKNSARYEGRGMNRVYREINSRLISNLRGPIAFERAVDYVQGRGVEQNLEQASKYYAAAAFSGIQKANLALAYMFRFGHGVEKNEVEERTYFNRAAFCWTFPEVMKRPEPFRYDENLCEKAAAELEQISNRHKRDEGTLWGLVGLVGLAALALSNGGGDVSDQYEHVQPNMSIDLDVAASWLGAN